VPKAIKRQIKKADKISAWMEAVQIAGFTEGEADKFFGKADAEMIQGLTVALRPPMAVRQDFLQAHEELSARL